MPKFSIVQKAINAARGSATISYVEPTAREVLRELDTGELRSFKQAIASERGIKYESASRTVQRHLATGAQAEKRGLKRGLSQEYGDTLKKLFPKKFDFREQKKYEHGATINVQATFHTSSNDWEGNIELNLTPEQIEELASAESEEDFWDKFNGEGMYNFPECERVDGVKKVKLSFEGESKNASPKSPRASRSVAKKATKKARGKR